jgi:hypothetical protein
MYGKREDRKSDRVKVVVDVVPIFHDKSSDRVGKVYLKSVFLRLLRAVHMP